MKRLIVIAIAIVLGFGSVAHAFDVEFSGMEVTLGWTEPTKNVMNSEGIVLDLIDLGKTWATWKLLHAANGATPCGEPVPASSLTGGGDVSVTCVIPTQNNAETQILFQAWASDTIKAGTTHFNVSEPVEQTMTIDLLATQPPS